MEKKTWETLDNVLHRKTSKSSPDAIQINDKLSTDKTEMADSFNTYFSTICATSEIDNPNNVPSHDVYLNSPTEAEFNFEQIDNMMVLHYINKLKPSHSCGHDNISSNVLKIIAMEVSPCLTLIINQVLSTGQFPKNLKTAKVIPIHKTGDKSLMKNYRPISILPVVSKIIENVMHTQLTDYFTLNKLFTLHNSAIHPHLIYGLNLLEFKHKRVTILQKKTIRILAFRPYISHSTSAFKELKIPMLKDLYTIQLYKIYYKNIHNILPPKIFT